MIRLPWGTLKNSDSQSSHDLMTHRGLECVSLRTRWSTILNLIKTLESCLHYSNMVRCSDLNETTKLWEPLSLWEREEVS